MIYFIANGAWYLKNFRSSTLTAFSSKAPTWCLHPKFSRSGSGFASGIKVKQFYLDPASKNFFKEIFSFLSFSFNFIHGRPSLVFSFNPKTNLYSLVACWLFRIPCVPNVSGVGVASQLGGITGKVYRALAGFFYCRASHVFFQNYDDYQAFLKAGWVQSDRAEVLPGSGVDLQLFQPFKKESGKLRFLMAVRLIKQKGVEEYLAAAREVLKKNTGCEFFLAGIKDESSRAIEESLLAALDQETNIHFVGHVEDMPELLKSVDCVVLPSYYPEGVPRNLIEAAASGKVIITTDTPGCREVVINKENGYLIEPKSVSQLSETMQEVLDLSEDKRHKMQRASRSLAEERFDEQIVIRRYLEVAERLTGNAFSC